MVRAVDLSRGVRIAGSTPGGSRLVPARSTWRGACVTALPVRANLRGGHASASCIVPIRQAGLHHARTGSQNARTYLTAYLSEHPDDLDMRWLLNVAAMTLGSDPASVPPQYRIVLAVFTSAEDPGRFVDVAAEKGLGAPGLAGGAAIEDIDNDGLLDVVVSSVDSCAPLRYYHHERDGSFRDRTAAAHLSDQLGGINLTATDYNNDGRVDLFVMRGGWEFRCGTRCCATTATARFTDVTRESGLSSGLYRTIRQRGRTSTTTAGLTCSSARGGPEQPVPNVGNGTLSTSQRLRAWRARPHQGHAWGDYDNDRIRICTSRITSARTSLSQRAKRHVHGTCESARRRENRS